jgi:hypothetical protein
MPAELAKSTSGASPEHMARLRLLFQDHNIALRNKAVHKVFVDRAFRAMSSRGKPAPIASFAALLDMYLATVSSYKIFRWHEDDVPVFMSCRHTVHMLVTLKLLESGRLRYPASYSDVLTDACKADAPEAGSAASRIAALDTVVMDILDPPAKVQQDPQDPQGRDGLSVDDLQDLLNSGAVDCPCPETEQGAEETTKTEPYGRYFDTFCNVFLELYLKMLQTRPGEKLGDVLAVVSHVLTCCWNVADVRLVPLTAPKTEALEAFQELGAPDRPPVLTKRRKEDETARIAYNAAVVRAFVMNTVTSVDDPLRLKIAVTECVVVIRDLCKDHVSESRLDVGHLKSAERAVVFPEERAWALLAQGATCGIGREHGELMMHLAYACKSTHSLAPYFVRKEDYRRFLSAQTDTFLDVTRPKMKTGSPVEYREAYKVAMNMAHGTYVKGTDIELSERKLAQLGGAGARWGPAIALAAITLAASFIG